MQYPIRGIIKARFLAKRCKVDLDYISAFLQHKSGFINNLFYKEKKIMVYGLGILALVVLIAIITSVKIYREYERGVIFRLGRYVGTRGPGFVLIIPFGIELAEKVSLRTVVQDVAPQDIITSDNVSVTVNAVLSSRVVNPEKSQIEVEDYSYAIAQLAQTALRSVLGAVELDELLTERDKLNTELEKVVSEHSEPWGIKVLSMEVKHVDIPEEMERAIARQAEAEREKRAKIISAKGERQAAENMIKAAKVLSPEPISIQLRYLHTLTEVAAEKNSTLILPFPIQLLTSILKASGHYKE